VPRKCIVSQADVQRFLGSQAYRSLQAWLRALNQAVLGRPNSTPIPLCPAVEGCLALLERLDRMVDDTPPEQGQMRFGNKAFRTWHAKLSAAAQELHALVVPPEQKEAVQELVPYLLDSFGNPVRIDYGTGHELHFVIWMYCLHALGLTTKEDLAALVTKVFARYLSLVRKIQQTYGQEPAGSRGVWCLDDHQFIPFIWGSAQLIDHPEIQPDSILNKEFVSKYADDYLYLGCIHYIHTVKKGPFFEHSPDLYNISGAASWEKINKGMFLKYNQDVLCKLPILQHLLFGSLFPCP
jgi:serine/threonine-protein phosphatase 2A activator